MSTTCFCEFPNCGKAIKQDEKEYCRDCILEMDDDGELDRIRVYDQHIYCNTKCFEDNIEYRRVEGFCMSLERIAQKKDKVLLDDVKCDEYDY